MFEIGGGQVVLELTIFRVS